MPPAPQQNSYLESKVLAAPPHRLHLMLIEGAIRHGRKADDSLRRGDAQAASASLLRVIDLVGEMLAGVREQSTDLNKKLADLYWYLFRRASEAKIHSDLSILAEVLRLLEYERQTWALACEKLASATTPGVAAGRVDPSAAGGGFSLEA